MFENPRRGRPARNFTTNAPKILDLKSSSEQIFSRKLPLGAPDLKILMYKLVIKEHKLFFCSHVIKVHLRTSGGQGIWQSQPTLMCTWSETLNCFNHAADKNKGYKK